MNIMNTNPTPTLNPLSPIPNPLSPIPIPNPNPLSRVPIELNRTELLVRFGFGSSNLSSGSGSVHQISVQFRVRFIEAKVWFGFGSVHQISVQVQVRFGSIM